MSYHLRRHLSRIGMPALVAVALSADVARGQSEELSAKSAVHVRDQYMTDLDTLHAKFVALANAI